MRQSQHITQRNALPITERGNIALAIYLDLKKTKGTYLTENVIRELASQALCEADIILDALNPYQGELNDIEWSWVGLYNEDKGNYDEDKKGYNGYVSDGSQTYNFIVRQDGDSWYCSGQGSFHKGDFPTPEAAMEWANDEWKKIR